MEMSRPLERLRITALQEQKHLQTILKLLFQINLGDVSMMHSYRPRSASSIPSLSKALNHIETENSQVSYSKPRGKNYRCRSKVNNLTSIKTVGKLQSSSSAQRVLISDIQRLPGKRKKYMTQLWCDLIKNGLKYQLPLSISKKTGRAVIFDGNHRLTILRNKNVKWVLYDIYVHPMFICVIYIYANLMYCISLDMAD